MRREIADRGGAARSYLLPGFYNCESSQTPNYVSQCPEAPKSVYGVEGPDGWRPFLERKDILVWRRNHPSMQVLKFMFQLNHSIVLDLQGMYEYKMYGSFSDVTAEEFLYVQNDLSKFRLSWDNRYVQPNILDLPGKIMSH